MSNASIYVSRSPDTTPLSVDPAVITTAPAGVGPGGTFRLDDLQLASRLSFFLWSSIPDETDRKSVV